MDGYAVWRNKDNWTWIKEIEILRQFFAFCSRNSRVDPQESGESAETPAFAGGGNDVVPFTSAEIVRIIAACDQIGRAPYERLRSAPWCC